MNEERAKLNASVAEEIRQENAKLIAQGSMMFACPYCGSWLPTPAAYKRFRHTDEGLAVMAMNPSHTCYCGKTTTKDPL